MSTCNSNIKSLFIYKNKQLIIYSKKKMSIQKILILSILSLSIQFFDADTKVIQLNSANFDKEVVNSDDIVMVLFYAPWCGHCKHFHPEYEKAAKALKGVFKIAGIDADSEKDIAHRYGINGFPTVKFFGLDKKNPEDYQGQRTASAVIDYMFTKAREITNSRLGVSSSTKKDNNTKKDNTKKDNTKKNNVDSDKDVVILTDDNFDDVVFGSEDMWLVAFYAPWCGHCQKLLPEWNAAATQLKGQVKIAKLDATTNQKMASRYQIQGYPTIKIFSPGKDKKVEEYQGSREQAGIVAYALEKLEKFGYVPETKQLINNDILKEVCENRVGICVIAFLPNIVDSSAKERNNYLDILKEVTKNNRGKPLYYLWAQGGDHFDFEEKLHLGFGYPAVVAINYKKKMYSVCRSSFNKDNLVNYLSNLLLGKEPLNKLPDGIKISKVNEWDKKDYVPPKEEDSNYDL